MCELKTMSFGGAIRPDGEVARTRLVGVSINDAAREAFVERSRQCHAMNVADLKMVDITPHLTGELVLGGGSRFQRIVLPNEDVTVCVAAVDPQHAVFHHKNI